MAEKYHFLSQFKFVQNVILSSSPQKKEKEEKEEKKGREVRFYIDSIEWIIDK